MIQDEVWNRVSQNRDQGKATWYFVDEFHLLAAGRGWFLERGDLETLSQMGRYPHGDHAEHQGPAFLPEIENIFENSDFVYLLNQASGRQKDALGASEYLRRAACLYDQRRPRRAGFFLRQNVILPFVDDFPRPPSYQNSSRPSPARSLRRTKLDKERIGQDMKYVIDSKTYENDINDEVHLSLHQLAFLANERRGGAKSAETAKRYGEIAENKRWRIPGRYLCEARSLAELESGGARALAAVLKGHDAKIREKQRAAAAHDPAYIISGGASVCWWAISLTCWRSTAFSATVFWK